MEAVSDQPPSQPDPLAVQKKRVEDASDFLSFCAWYASPACVDGLCSGYYWEDVQRALRIAAGLEKWPD